MILTDVQTYLKNSGKASLSEISIHFRMDSTALRPILKKLVNKGRIRQMQGEKCGGCCQCQSEILEVYEWVGYTRNFSQPISFP